MKSSVMVFGLVTVAVPMLAAILCAQEAQRGAQEAQKAQENSSTTTNASSSDESIRSLTILPVMTKPEQPVVQRDDGTKIDMSERLAAAVGRFVEIAGVEEIELAALKFRPTEKDDMAAVASELAKFVQDNSIGTQYVLYSEIHGTPQSGLEEIRTVVVDKAGNVILADRDDKSTYARTSRIVPKNPMTCCLFVSKKLQKLWNLADPMRSDAPEGKMAEYWRKQSGLPKQDELDAIDRRLETLTAKVGTGSLTVYPVRVGNESDALSAAQLAERFNKAKLAKTEVADVDPRLRIQGDPNEQKVLWDTARAFRQFLQKNPPSTDHALLADFAIGRDSTGQTRVRYVHVIVCDRKADWVIVDFQNSHHPDFQAIDPSSREDCNRLVMVRAKGLLSGD